MEFHIPGRHNLTIDTIILDLNGTLSVGGVLVLGVADRLAVLKERGYQVVFFSGDTRGNAHEIATQLGIEFMKAGTTEEKADLAKHMNPATCATIGNGLIDAELMRVVSLGIVTLQAEGIHTKTLALADIVVPTIVDALDLFVDEKRLIATMRL